MNMSEYQGCRAHKENFLIRSGVYKCPVCNKEFSNNGFLTHILKQHVKADNGIKNSGGYNNHYNSKDYRKKLSSKKKEYDDKTLGKLIDKCVSCARCHRNFVIHARELSNIEGPYYCSSFCAHARLQKSSTKEKIAKSTRKSILKKYREDTEYADKVAKALANSKHSASSNEKYIIKYMQEHHPNDNWIAGGFIFWDDIGVSRDMFSNKLKVCFEYDGFVHFKDAFGQLKEKQAKDKALELWCLANNWRLIRISESWFLEHNKNIEVIEKAIYESTESVIKIGREY